MFRRDRHCRLHLSIDEASFTLRSVCTADSELICKHTEKENGLQDLMEIMHESLMVSERREYLQEEGLSGNKCNGYPPGRTYGHGLTLTFRIPCVTDTATFPPPPHTGHTSRSGGRVRTSCRHVVHQRPDAGAGRRSVRHSYGEHYSKASISRMLD